MISVEAALSVIREQPVQRRIIQCPLDAAHGHHLAAPIQAPFDVPAFDNSAMDGYALCGKADRYKLVGEIAAGDTQAHSLQAGEAMRIFTGGRVPANTTAVLMQEKSRVEEGTFLFPEMELEVGQNIRPKGGELRARQVVFDLGQPLSPATLGLLGSLGYETADVFEKPAVRLIVTGNELIRPGQPLADGQIYESNSFALGGALKQYGFECQETQLIPDDYDQTKAGISAFLNRSDVLLISGGISVGEYDYVRRALLENGVEELFYRVFQRPGKPLFFGRKNNTFVFALPGNPASSLSCFYIHVLPLLRKFSGATELELPRVSIPLAHDYHHRAKRPSFLKARWANGQVEILDKQGSSMIHTLALGNALVYLKEPQVLRAGELVACVVV